MATTLDVIQDFVAGYGEGKASGGRLFIDGDKLVNYSTTIAQRVEEVVIINATKYSPTTTKHQNRLFREAEAAGLDIETVLDIPEGTYTLVRTS